MSQNGQTHFKNLEAFAAIFLKYVWPFWDIMHKGLILVINFLKVSDLSGRSSAIEEYPVHFHFTIKILIFSEFFHFCDNFIFSSYI